MVGGRRRERESERASCSSNDDNERLTAPSDLDLVVGGAAHSLRTTSLVSFNNIVFYRDLSYELSRSIRIYLSYTNQRCEKISNSSSFGIIDIAEPSSTNDRIIVIVDTACFIHDGAYR